jgi:hypothetical protein
MSCADDEQLWINVALDADGGLPSLASPGRYAEVAIAEFMAVDLLAMLGRHRTRQDEVLWADIREEVSARKEDIIAWASEIVGRPSIHGSQVLALRFRLDPKTTAVVIGQAVFEARPMDP